MTTNEILTIARKKLLETTSEVLEDTTLLIYANLTLEDIYKKVFPNDQILSTTVAFTNGSSTNLPATFGTMYGSAIDSGNRTFEELSIADFAQNVGQNAVTIEGGVMKVFPTTTASLTVKYYPTFPSLTTSVNPTINSYFHELIVYGILSRAYEDLQDQQLSTFYSTKYSSMLKDKIATQSNYEEDNQRGGQMFTEQRLISDGGFSFSSSPNNF